MSRKVTVATVNAALKARGVAERLCKGNGYFYFVEGNASDWYTSSVSVFRASELTLEQWIKEYERFVHTHASK